MTKPKGNPARKVVGILSDTHGYLHPNLFKYLSDVDLIIHAGDVGDLSILDALSPLAELKAVWGNIDGWDIRHVHPEHNRFEFAGVRFWVTHIAGKPSYWQRGMGSALKADPPDIFVCGHSHILQIERVKSFNNMLYINPGAAGRQGFHQVKTLVRLIIEDEKAIQAEVVHLD